MKLNRFKKGSEQAYYFGQYPHRYVEVVENTNPLSELPRPYGRGFLLHSPTLPVAFRYG